VSEDLIKLGHGSGGVLSRRLLRETVLKSFTSPLLASLGDSAHVELDGQRLAFTSDSYVVDPLFFPGGDIGKLAVFGTVNDLAVSGASPAFISCSLIIEEGFPIERLDAVLASMRDAAQESSVEIVTGDTKVVQRGKADGLFINTSGVGSLAPDRTIDAEGMRTGDVVILSGAVGEHGAAVLAEREGLNLESTLVSDCAPLTAIAGAVFRNAGRVSFMRDVTRGGLATILNEAVPDNLGILVREDDIPIRPEVRSICELLGLDPLYLACEGRLTAVVDADSADAVVESIRKLTNGQGAAAVGEVTQKHAGQLVAETTLGTRRLLQMLSGEQLPRIC